MDTVHTERRLPIYFVLDCSESMLGEPIELLQQGMEQVLGGLRSEPHALETAWVSVICFAERAEQVMTLTAVPHCALPALRPLRPGTALGGALGQLCTAMQTEVRRHTSTQKGDWRPLVFLLTDGSPTDGEAWKGWRDALRQFNPLLIALGCGRDVDIQILCQLTEHVFLLEEDSPADFRRLFQWITASALGVSQQPGSGAGLPRPPSGLSRPSAARRAAGPRTGEPYEIFLTLWCSVTLAPYLIRYRQEATGVGYIPVRSHVVEASYLAGRPIGEGTMSLNTGRLVGIVACPRCQSPHTGRCTACDTLFCADNQPHLSCPRCKRQLRRGGPDDDVNLLVTNG